MFNYPLPEIPDVLIPTYGHLGLGKDSFDAESYPRLDSLGIRAWRAFGPLLENEAGTKFLQQLSSDVRVSNLEGKMISGGTNAARFEIKNLAMWYLWLLNRSGKQKADIAIERFLNTLEVEVWSLIGIEGLNLQSEIVLTDRFKLILPDKLPECDLKNSILQSRFSHGLLNSIKSVNSFIAGRASVPKLCGDDPSEQSSQIEALFEWYRDAYDIIMLLNCIPGVVALPSIQTSVTDDETPFGPFNGSGGGSSLYGRTVRRSSAIDAELCLIFPEIWAAFRRKRENEKISWRHCLTRLALAKSSIDPADQVLDLGIALEMMLQADNNTREQLSLTFRLRGSWLVEPLDSTKRKKAYLALKTIYNCRSDVAHSGRLKESNMNIFAEGRDEFFGLAEQIARTLLLRPSVDWESIIIAA